jgi:glycosyltransferase involved in cell wall biosynthesis
VTKPKITIITATHYRPDLLARCIVAVQQSTFTDYEHLVAADHCPKAREVYEIFKDDNRIKFYETADPHLPNHGARSQNLGIEKSESDIICYCNDDNMVMPNHLEIMYNSLSGGKYDVVYSKTHEIRMGRGDHTIKKILERDFHDDLDPEANVRSDLLYSDPRDMSNMGHTKEILKTSGNWRLKGDCPTGIEDTDFMDRVDAAAEKRIIKKPIYSSVYYVRNAVFCRDDAYYNAVKSLGEGETFVYPDLLLDSGVISKKMLEK